MLACSLVTCHKVGHAKENKPQANAQQVYSPATTVQSDSQPSGSRTGAPIRRRSQEPDLQTVESRRESDLCPTDSCAGIERRVRRLAPEHGTALGHSWGDTAQQERPLARQPATRCRHGGGALLENARRTPARRAALWQRSTAAVCFSLQADDPRGRQSPPSNWWPDVWTGPSIGDEKPRPSATCV